MGSADQVTSLFCIKSAIMYDVSSNFCSEKISNNLKVK